MIPDDVVFGWKNEQRELIFYGEVRKIADENQRIILLKMRLEAFFFSQVAPMVQLKSAFPLLMMTCIGMETLGRIFTNEKSEDGDAFVSIAKKMHQFFGRNPGKKFEESFITSWSQQDWDKIDCYGRLLYKYLRNTMVHGYQGKAVFLSYEDTDTYLVNDNNGHVTLNPTWFWKRLNHANNQLFTEAIEGQANSPIRKHCLKYIKNLVNE